jgi:hypothetical protein
MGGGTSIRCVFLSHMLLVGSWKGSVYVTAISSLPEPLYRYGIEDIQKLLSVLMRGKICIPGRCYTADDIRRMVVTAITKLI